MDRPTPTHLAALRDTLVHRQHELRTEIASAEEALVAEAQANAGEVTDQKDTAQRLQRGEMIDAQERRDRDELALVDSALARLDKGVYGDCAACGEPIALQRLQVQPAAPRCAACQADAEHVAAQSRAPARH
jgi:RNA polymerase-binding protein DksA